MRLKPTEAHSYEHSPPFEPQLASTTNAAGANAPGGRRARRGFGGGFGRGGFSGPRASREEWLQPVRDPIHTVVGRYKGKIKVWDVVNEAIANLFRVFLKHEEYVKVVTLWGVNDAVSWRAESRPLLIDGNDQPKPAFDAQPSSQ